MKMEHHIFFHQTKKNYTNQRIYENGGAHRLKDGNFTDIRSRLFDNYRLASVQSAR